MSDPDFDFAGQEVAVAFDAFTKADAVALGMLLYRKALEITAGGVVDIRTTDSILFHAAIGEATSDNDSWIARKSATALRFQASTLRVAQMLDGRGDPHASGWLDSARYAILGGAFPIRVHGAGVVAVASTSGLGHPDSEHDFIVDTIREYHDSRRSVGWPATV